MTRHLALTALVFAACVQPAPDAITDAPLLDASASTDASTPIDARPLDTTPPQQGCAMTNMPNARDYTFVDGDPVPPDFLNDVQDMINGDKTASFQETFLPQFITADFGAGVGTWDGPSIVTDGSSSKNPAFTSAGITASASADAIAVLPFRKGFRLTGVQQLVCGNGTAGLLSLAIWAGPSYSSILTLGGASTQRGLAVDSVGTNAWRTLTLTHLGGVNPFLAWDTTNGPAALLISAAFSTGNGISVGPVTLTWDRL